MISPFRDTQQDADDMRPNGAQSHKCDGFHVGTVTSGKTFQRHDDFTVDASVAEIYESKNGTGSIDSLDQLYRLIDQLRKQSNAHDVRKIHQQNTLTIIFYELYFWHSVSLDFKIRVRINRLPPWIKEDPTHSGFGHTEI